VPACAKPLRRRQGREASFKGGNFTLINDTA
jgi:hypothetical protein